MRKTSHSIYSAPITTCRGVGPKFRLALALVWLVLALVFSDSARACDPNCDNYTLLIYGTPAVLGTTLISPLVAQALDSRDNSPYWTAVGLTAAASIGGALIARERYNERRPDLKNGIEMAAMPFALGSTATFLVYKFWPRAAGTSTDTSSTARFPMIGIAPLPGGGALSLTLRF